MGCVAKVHHPMINYQDPNPNTRSLFLTNFGVVNFCNRP